MTKHRELIVKIFDIILKSKVCPETSPKDWAGIILELDRKNMLYCAMDMTGQVRAVWAAYRIPKWDELYREIIPPSERGHILYVPFFVSIDKSQNHLLRALKNHLRENPEVTEIVYARRNNDEDVRHFKFKHREGLKHVGKKVADLHTASA